MSRCGRDVNSAFHYYQAISSYFECQVKSVTPDSSNYNLYFERLQVIRNGAKRGNCQEIRLGISYLYMSISFFRPSVSLRSYIYIEPVQPFAGLYFRQHIISLFPRGTLTSPSSSTDYQPKFSHSHLYPY